MSNIKHLKADRYHKNIKEIERSENALLVTIPEYQEYMARNRKASKKAKHNKEFFKKNNYNETKDAYHQTRRLERMYPEQQIVKKSIWQKFVDWVYK